MDSPVALTAIIDFVNTFQWVSQSSKVTSINDLSTSKCVWSCMNEIYPAWFDESIHPETFENEEDALLTFVHFLEEYHEKRYKEIFDTIRGDLTGFLSGNWEIVLLTYEMVILAALQGEDQQMFIDNVLTLSPKSQVYLQEIVLKHPLPEDSNPQKDSLNWSKSVFLSTKLKEDASDVGRADFALYHSGDSEAEIAKLQKQIAELKVKLLKTETEKESMYENLKHTNEKLKLSEEQCENLKSTVSHKKEAYLKDAVAQSEEFEKQIDELKVELEAEKKKRKKVEDQLDGKTKECEELQQSIKNQMVKLQTLEGQLAKYKSKIEELSTLKEEKKHIELKLTEALQKVNQVEADNKNVSSIRKSLESYKERVADLEMSISTLLTEKEALEEEKLKSAERLQELDKALKLRENEATLLQADLASKVQELKDKADKPLGQQLSSLDQEVSIATLTPLRPMPDTPSASSRDRSISEEAFRKIENELDDLKRLKERLEKSYAASNAKVASLEAQLAQTDSGKPQNKQLEDVSAQLASTLLQLDKQIDEIRQLRESKDELTVRLMEMIDAQQKGSRTPELTKINELMEQLAAQNRQDQTQSDSTMRAKLEAQFDLLFTAMKEQLEIRERENEYLKNSIKETVNQSQLELQLVSSALYTLGMKYHKLRSYCSQLKNENEAVTMRLQTRGMQLTREGVPPITNEGSLEESESS